MSGLAFSAALGREVVEDEVDGRIEGRSGCVPGVRAWKNGFVGLRVGPWALGFRDVRGRRAAFNTPLALMWVS